MESEESENIESLDPRNYQQDLIRLAVKQNTIIYLPTGSGKTFIAVCTVKELAKDYYANNYSNGGKVTIMVAITVQLVHQHVKYFQKYTPFKIKGYSGDMQVDFWSGQQWLEEFDSCNILIMTPQILVNIVSAAFLDMNKVNLLIVDECHQAVDCHPMRQIMMLFKNLQEQPRVLGLTATLLNGNVKDSKLIDEVQNLEVSLHSKVATVDSLQLVFNYSANPKESIVNYHMAEDHPVITEVLERLKSQEILLRAVKVNPSKLITQKNLNCMLLKKEKAYEKFYKMLMDAQENIKMFGVAGARIVSRVLINHLEFERRCCCDQKSLAIVSSLNTLFMTIQRKLDDVYTPIPEHIRVLKFSTNKVQTLVQILRKFKSLSSQELCGIVFVQRKNTAIYLHHLLKEICETYTDLNYIKSDFIHGSNSNPLSGNLECLYYSKLNKQVVSKFNSKETNLLIASNVIEEGIDVPMCTLVVKFDTPTNYREYIQSKGRARHSTSLYYMMVKNTEYRKFAQSYATFKEMENILNNYLIGQNELRSQPSEKEVQKIYDENTYYYVNKDSDSACVSLLNAIQLLMMYCSSFEVDMYTLYQPTWYVEEVAKRFVVYVEMPITCPLLNSIKSDACDTKKEAKRSAALRTCIALHKCGELTDELLPKVRHVDPQLTQFLFKHWPEDGQKSDGVTNKKRPYAKFVPACLQSPLSQRFYLHIIHFHPQFTADSLQIYEEALMKMYTDNLCFGLITTQEVPNICEFPVFITSGTIKVTFAVNENVLTLTPEEFLSVKNFHHMVFKDILNIDHPFLLLGDLTNYLSKYVYLVPVDKAGKIIDMQVLNEHKSIRNPFEEPTLQQKLELAVNNDTYLRKIVTPYYRDESRQYLVLEVSHSLTANSPFPNDTFSSYAAYFQSKYNKLLVNPNLPLLRVKALSSNINNLMPRGAGSKRHHDEIFLQMEINLIPELCVKQDFPAGLWIMAKLLPSALHRFVQLIRVESLRAQIAKDTELGEIQRRNHKPLSVNANLIRFQVAIDDSKENSANNDGNMDGSMDVDSYDSSGVDEIKLADVLGGNKVVSETMDNLQYPWKEDKEPKDFRRDLDVTTADLDILVEFIKGKPIKHNTVGQMSQSPVKRLAINYNTEYQYKSIKLLERQCDENAGPELCSLYEALCTAKSRDIVNLERLETLGDSLLKLVASLYIFERFPNFSEGQATELKGRLVSNRNLFYLARKRKIDGFLKAHELKPNDEWLPIGYGIPKEAYDKIQSLEMPISSLFQLNVSLGEQVSGVLTESTLESIEQEKYPVSDLEEDNSYASMCSFLGLQMIPDKSLADACEALIGCYFETCGLNSAVKFMQWLGILPKGNIQNIFTGEPPNPVLRAGQDIHVMLPRSHIKEVEEILGYQFQNKAYLLQALTHSSYTTNLMTLSYQTLEFIGDAVLDFLITGFIYENSPNLGPGDLTDLRSALVNNETFASYVVKLRLHKYLKHFNSKLMHNISIFEKYQSLKNNDITPDVLILLNENDMNAAEHIDCPKVLGDIFESLMGAIFLDSKRDLMRVWQVVYRIMHREIIAFSNCIPKNPIRLLTEQQSPLQPKISAPVEICGGTSILVKLDFVLDGKWVRVHGFGNSRTAAKKAAAKIALRLFELKKAKRNI